jgi:internalin A
LSLITPLGEAKNLQYLDLKLRNLEDCSPLANLTNLTKIFISDGKCSDATFLQSLSQLEDVRIHMRTNHTSTFPGTIVPSTVRAFSFSESKIEDVSFLKDLPNLKKLDLYKADNVQHWDALKSLNNLVELILPNSTFSE